jgi:drug/metabolite transporter (DMT)-like permease
VYILGCWIISIAAGLCFRQGGIDTEGRWFWFVVGNVLGISSTWFLIRVYSLINANLAVVLCSSVPFIIFQVVLWGLYHAELSLIQWIGIVVVTIGTAIAVADEKRPAVVLADAEDKAEPQTAPPADQSERTTL